MPLLTLVGPATGKALKSWLVVTVEPAANGRTGTVLWIERVNELGNPKAKSSQLIIWARPEEVAWLAKAIVEAQTYMESLNAATIQAKNRNWCAPEGEE